MFQEISVNEFSQNPFETIGKQWMLVTAGSADKFNTMTASWGGLGVLWQRNVVTVYLRPQRYTKKFVDQGEYFTISFYPEHCRKALQTCGTVSGRECDKGKEAGLTPYVVDQTMAFKEAEYIFVCRKLYHQEMKPECFDVASVEKENYPEKDYHTMYIGEIVKVLKKAEV